MANFLQRGHGSPQITTFAISEDTPGHTSCSPCDANGVKALKRCTQLSLMLTLAPETTGLLEGNVIFF